VRNIFKARENTMQTNFSDYIVYVDESGDHGISSIDPDYPVLVLSFCIFSKQEYSHKIIPSFKTLKFKTFGHDMVIFREHDIRKKLGAFSRFNKEQREAFLEEIGNIIRTASFTLIAVVIDKMKLVNFYTSPAHPYHLAMEFGLERVYRFLKEKRQGKKLTHFIFEKRGSREDQQLELEFRRVCDGNNYFHKPLPFQIIFADKKVNSDGLQLADMTARPIGLSVIRPDQKNKAMEILKRKFYTNRVGNFINFGLKIFPH